MAPDTAVYQFGPFTLDPGKRRLLRGDDVVKLYPKEFDTLLALVERRGEVIEKEDLLRRVWPDSVVEEGNLTTHVSHLRKVLGGTPELRDYIVTIPGRGYQFVAAVTRAPDAVLPAPRPSSVPWRSRLVIAGTVAVLAIAAAIVATRTGRKSPPAFQQLTFQRGAIWSARFAPDGQTIVYSAAWNGAPLMLFSTRLGSPESRALGHSADLLSVAPSGELAVSVGRQFIRRWESAGMLARVPLEGGAPREVLTNVKDAEWSADGTQLAVIKRRRSSDILEFPAGYARYEVQGFIMQPRLSRASGAIAFLQRRSGDESVELLQRDGTHRTLAIGLIGVTGLAWSASGAEVLFTVAAAGSTEVHAVTPSGRRRLVVRTAGEWSLNDVAPDGRTLMTQHHIRGQTAGGSFGEPERDLSWLDRSAAAALSDDGQTLILAEIGAGGGAERSIYVRKIDGSPAIRLGSGEPAALSPDARWVAAIQGGAPERLVLLPIGPGEARPLPNGSITDYYRVKWLPDNRRLVFGAIEAGRDRRIYMQTINGGNPEPAAWAGGVGETVFLRDGETYLARGPAGYELGSINGRVARPVPNLTREDHVIQAASDGRHVFVMRPQGTTLLIDRFDLETGTRTRIKDVVIQDPAGVMHVGPEFPTFLITPDGRTYAYSYMRVLSALYLIDRLE